MMRDSIWVFFYHFGEAHVRGSEVQMYYFKNLENLVLFAYMEDNALHKK